MTYILSSSYFYRFDKIIRVHLSVAINAEKSKTPIDNNYVHGSQLFSKTEGAENSAGSLKILVASASFNFSMGTGLIQLQSKYKNIKNTTIENKNQEYKHGCNSVSVGEEVCRFMDN